MSREFFALLRIYFGFSFCSFVVAVVAFFCDYISEPLAFHYIISSCSNSNFLLIFYPTGFVSSQPLF